MRSNHPIQLSDVQAVYSGPEFAIWELLMGEQIHVGGQRSSEQLADCAGIQPDTVGIDLCCCSGAGMRFLVRWRNVRRMVGVDATPAVVELGQQRCQREQLADQIELIVADACATGLSDSCADFVWGEDAWCYVIDKARLIAEAARLVKSNGVIAFTDWVEGPVAMREQEQQRLLRFMKFPNLQDLSGYSRLLMENDCHVTTCEDTGLFAAHVDLYLSMLRMQLTSDALRIVGFHANAFQSILEEMTFMQRLAHERKIVQGRVVARKKTIHS